MEIRLKYINQDSFYGSDYFIKRVGYEEKWDRVKRLGDTYYENELLERSVTEKYGSNLKIGKVENTASAIGTTENGKLSTDEYVGHNLENVDKLKTAGGSVGVSTSGLTSIGVNYSDKKQEGITKNTVIGNVEIEKSSGDEINRDLDTMTEITEDRDFKTNINVESQTINYIKNPEKFKEDLQKAKNEIYDIYHAVDSTVNLQGKENRNISEQLGEVRQAKVIYNLIDSRLQEAKNQEDIAKAFEGASEDLGYKVKVIFTDPSNSPQLIGVDKNGNKYIKDGTAYVDENTGIGYILVNTKSPANSTKAGVIGTIAEEQSHVIGKKEGKQKVVPDGSQKGLESLGRPTNDYFKKQYSKNDKAIDLKSDGKDYSNVDFGENVGDHISSEDLKFKNNYKKNVLPKHKGYQKFLKNTLSIALDVSPLGVVKGATEAILGYDAITGEELDLVTRTMGIIPIFDDIYKTGRRGVKLLTPTRKVEAVLADGTKAVVNIDDTIKGTNNTKKIISSTDTSITKIEVETPKIKPVEDIIGTKTGNKELNNAINTRGTEYYLDLRAQKATAPIDFDGHIINGEINARGRAVGGHSMLGGNVRIDAYAAKNPISPNGVRNVVISVYDPSTGTWIQKVDRFGEPQLTTLFPENWSKSRIIVEVDIAYKNRIISQTRRNIWKGTTPSGIKVEGYIAPNTTVFPLQ